MKTYLTITFALTVATIFAQTSTTPKTVIVTKYSKTVPIGKKWILEAGKTTKVQVTAEVLTSNDMCNAMFLSNPRMIMSINRGDIYKNEGFGIIFKNPDKVPYTNDFTYELTTISFVDKTFSIYDFQDKKPEEVGVKKLTFKAGENVFVGNCLESIEMIEVNMTLQELADERKKQVEELQLKSVTMSNVEWKKTNLPYTGKVTCLAINGSNIFAGTAGGGVFLSNTNGSSWTSVNNGLQTVTNGPEIYINCMAISGTNIFAGQYGAMFLSTNNGKSWTSVSNGLPKVEVNSLAINGINIFAGTDSEDGVFLSANNGTDWTAMNNGFSNLSNAFGLRKSINAFAFSGDNIYAGDYGFGVFFSTNNGNSWKQKNEGFRRLFVSIRSLVIRGNNIFAGTDNEGIYFTTDNSSSWIQVNNGLPNATKYECPDCLVSITSLLISGTYIFAGTLGGGVYFSSNNGKSWVAFNNGLLDVNIWSLSISGTNIFAGTESGIWQCSLTAGLKK